MWGISPNSYVFKSRATNDVMFHLNLKSPDQVILSVYS